MGISKRTGPADGLAVLVTGVTSLAGLAVVRDLGLRGFRVIGADDRLLPLGLHSRFSGPYRRYPRRDEPGLLEKLLEIIADTRPDVFLPTGSHLVELTSKHRATFEKLTRVNVPPYDGFLAAFDNARTMEECRGLGISCPQVLTLTQAKHRLETHASSPVPYAVVVKPRKEYGGAQGVSFCRDVKGLLRKIEDCQASFGEPLLQEYIPGDASAVRTLLVLFDRESRLVAYFTTQKIRQWPVTGGVTAMSISTDDRELLSQVLPFFEKWRWQGPAEVELKVDPRDGKAKVIEINPRIAGYLGFSVQCGLDYPQLAVLAAADRLDSQACPAYTVGARYLNLGLYLKAVRTELRRSNRKLALLRRTWQELRNGTAPDQAKTYDPLPRIGKAVREAQNALSRLRNRREPAKRSGLRRRGQG